MPVFHIHAITRDYVRRHPDSVFLFGDNLEGRGFGGQAAAMRGEPNAFGIPTKRRPSMEPDAFLSNADFDEVHQIYVERFTHLLGLLRAGIIIVVPANGLGTGRARLQEKAPRIWIDLQTYLNLLETVASSLES